MTEQNQVIAWCGMALLCCVGFVAMFAMAMLAFKDRDDARRIRATLGVLQLTCTPATQAGNQCQLSPHETQPEPTPALAPGRWIDERYHL
ncbi:hypothetical protein ACNFBR_24995 [Pseudomonas sp. NY11955]|uniref:hypothetical protein n=1 Tax=Pseudomonas sp. NY11955 TaxID=3400363 RepID=UPI003A8457DE